MCLEKVKSMVVLLSVVDLLTSDAHSRLYISFMNSRNVSSFFTFVLKSPQRRIGTLVSTNMIGCTYGKSAWCSNTLMFETLAPG